MKTKTQQGFTLIEVMIAIAILAILVGIAYPMYIEQIKKSRRADAKVTLNQLSQFQENYHSDYPTYAGKLGTTTAYSADDPTANTLGCKDACKESGGTVYSGEGHYIISIASASASAFIITAEVDPNGAQKDDSKCLGFAIDSRGRKAASATSAADAESNLGGTNADPNRCWS